MTNEEILLLITLISTILISTIGFSFTIYQIKQSNKVKQAEFINKLLENIRFNDNISKAVYTIDYSNNWYNKEFHIKHDIEKNIDAYFSQSDYVCYLYQERLLSKNDFSIFEYHISRIYKNYQCLHYLWNLYHWSKKNNTKCAFNNLICFIKSQLNEECISRFESKNASISKFEKYLNF